MWQGVPDVFSLILFFVIISIVGMLEGMQIAFLATSKMRKEQCGTSFFGKKTADVILKRNEQNLPTFMIGRQLLVVSCFFVLVRATTLDVRSGGKENIFGVSDGAQDFLNTGLHAALQMTILGSSICSGAWVLARIQKRIFKLELDETYVGTPESPVLSKICFGFSDVNSGYVDETLRSCNAVIDGKASYDVEEGISA
eukprot:CAMPEP_0172537868 /NCGR_PEP_ID=MMETSP1067-20121228/9396_1 /TAXON_ID=265564 ORGANISM="Thalassiosira punctigera, Strain Tpunct2005C2" /NCGR_SAMPLE_ID=MMETSP1067 /ASSEMBLY_ACC=CAM_ASM_000444 /LENGTH=197 /DNA_ID=CAMNT_0013323263 /DNA_START=626 /DNA_END=1217 /DNA_ORIENTATION=+